VLRRGSSQDAPGVRVDVADLVSPEIARPPPLGWCRRPDSTGTQRQVGCDFGLRPDPAGAVVAPVTSPIAPMGKRIISTPVPPKCGSDRGGTPTNESTGEALIVG
jgi:hypothetical protein